MSLVERKPGRPDGSRMLDDKREEIIRTSIDRYYLNKNHPSVSQLVRDIRTSCISAGLKPPHRRTIETRLEDIDLQKRAKRRGKAEIVKRTIAVPGTLSASRPLQIVQADYTKADIFIVDEETRLPMGRPWLTLAMDVYSRMVTGFYLAMEAPSRLSSLCLLHAVFDKSPWLREREIIEPWMVAGLPETLHIDNGSYFRMLHMLRGHLMGENKTRFGDAMEEIVGRVRQSRTSSQLHLI